MPHGVPNLTPCPYKGRFFASVEDGGRLKSRLKGLRSALLRCGHEVRLRGLPSPQTQRQTRLPLPPRGPPGGGASLQPATAGFVAARSAALQARFPARDSPPRPLSPLARLNPNQRLAIFDRLAIAHQDCPNASGGG